MFLMFLPPILDAGVVAPSITDQPDSIEVYEGQTATFTVAATGGGLAYQWQLSNDSGGSWSNISGATSLSYTTLATVRATDNNDQFRCVVTNTAGTVNSNAATLTVWNPLALGADLACWLDPTTGLFTQRTGASATTAATNGDPVGTWRARNGTINGTAPSDAKRAIYRATGLNGTPCVEFDGTDDELVYTTDLAAAMQNKSFFYVFAAAASANESVAGPIVFWSTNSSSTLTRLQVVFNQSGTAGLLGFAARRLDADSAGVLNSASAFTNDENLVVGVELLFGSSDAYLRKNGSRIASSTSFLTDGATQNLASLAVDLGSNNATSFFDGFIGHFIATCPSAAHDSTTMAKIEGFINYKSGNIY